jgi:oxygen-dependent protoporphyrinogen oxidase
MARALLDLVKPRSATGDDVGVFELVSARFGREVAERLIEPLLGSIHAGTTRGLSAAATAPQLIAASRSHRSLLLGLRHIASPPTAKTGAGGARPPMFLAPRGGMQALTDTLVERLRARGTRFEPSPVTSLSHQRDGVVVQPDGRLYDGAVLAVPAPTAARTLAPVDDDGAASTLGQLAWASVAIATLAIDATAIEVAPGLSGFLVAPGDGLLMTACSFGSNKWPHWSAPGTSVLRVSVGRAGDERWSSLSDEALVAKLGQELGSALRPGRGPRPPLDVRAWRVSRWPEAFPQFEVGHLQRMAATKAALARTAPRIALAGASYDGAGVPACIGSGRKAAASVRGAARARAGS